jgi:hypothetical protein
VLDVFPFAELAEFIDSSASFGVLLAQECEFRSNPATDSDFIPATIPI